MKNKMMKIYIGLWAIIAVVYGLWMTFIMSWDQYKYIIPTAADLALPADQFIAKFDGMLYGPMYASEPIYWLWVIGSTILLFFYAFFIKKILFCDHLATSGLELPWWSSGSDSMLLMQGSQVQSLVRELDLTCHN